MTERDDPVHPNWDGVCFAPATDRLGIIVHPLSAQSRPPYSYMRLEAAVRVLGDLRAVIHGLHASDPKSYLAWFLEDVAADMADAINACQPPPEESDDAPSSDTQGPAA